MVSTNCEDKSWQEEMYWNNFQFARFSLTLPPDFHHHLIIPKKFTDHMRTHLPEKVILKVDKVAWNVILEKGRNDVKLQGSGWQEFAKAYSLRKSDRLMFKYDRHDCFEVMLFDQANSCEKEISYFVKRGQQPNLDANDDISGEAKEHSATDRNQGRDDDTVYTLGSTPRRNPSSKAARSRDGCNSDEGDETSHEENFISTEDCTTPKKTATKRAREVPSNYSGKKYCKVEKTTPKQKSLHASGYKSNRRPVTEAEKEMTLEKARKTSNQHPNSFVVIMRPTSVYKRFHMSIPKEWILGTTVGIRFKKGLEVVLRVKEKTWVCGVTCDRSNTGFYAGWKKFAEENFLEEFDVCLFNPCGFEGEKHVLDVNIFRVVSKVVQPSLISPEVVKVNETSSDDISQEDEDSDHALRNRHRKNGSVTHKSFDSSRGAPNREDLRVNRNESSDEENFTSEKDCTPRKFVASQGRQVPVSSSQKRKHVDEKLAPKENGEITYADKLRVQKAVNEAATKYNNSFIVVLKPSSVQGRFFMGIPRDWTRGHNLEKGQEVILRLGVSKEETWRCTLCSTITNNGLQAGWKRFVVDNKLEESDACLFVPARENDGKCVLDVHIFRVRSPVL